MFFNKLRGHKIVVKRASVIKASQWISAPSPAGSQLVPAHKKPGREQCVLLSAELMTEPRVEQARASSDSLSWGRSPREVEQLGVSLTEILTA